MADRKPIIAGNWKMHLTHLEAIHAVQKLAYSLDSKDYDEVDVVVCPAFTALRSVQTTLESDRIPIALGVLYPFFATFLGWLGVALTGSDTSSNVLFGSLQKITAQQLGLNPVLIVTANSTGGVMGKMISLTSLAVAVAATGMALRDTRAFPGEWKLYRGLEADLAQARANEGLSGSQP